METKLNDGIIQQYRENLTLIQRRIDKFIDPGSCPPDFVRSLIHTEMIIEKGITTFSNDDELMLLDRLEKWYTDKELDFPNKDWLERQRDLYKS